MFLGLEQESHYKSKIIKGRSEQDTGAGYLGKQLVEAGPDPFERLRQEPARASQEELKDARNRLV